METLNRKTLSFPKYMARSFVLLAAVFMMACNGSGGGGGGNSTYYPIHPGSCSNCAGTIPNPVPITTVNSASINNSIELRNLQIYGEGSRLSGYGYTGDILAQGQLIVNTPEFDYGNMGYGPYNGIGYSYSYGQGGGCVLNPGTYELRSLNIGKMGIDKGNIIMNMATTNGGIELRIDDPLVGTGGAMIYGNRLYAKVTVLRVNGVNCSSNFYGIFN